MDARYCIKVPQSVKTAKRQREKDSSIQWCQYSDLNCRKTEKSSQTKLATGACKNWIFCAVNNFSPCVPVTIFPQYRAPVAGQPEAAPFVPCCSCSFYWPRDAFLKFSQSYDNISGVTAGLLVRFRLNILKFAQKWQGSSSSFGEIYGYVFVRFMSLCKSVCSRGEPRVFVSSELGSVWHDMARRVPVCLSACFCGLNPRTGYHTWAWISSEHP